ncbi:hypothetical protein AALA13_07455 [Lachnospiraceae bacterium 50-23]
MPESLGYRRVWGGRSHSIDTTNTDQAIVKFEEDLGGKLAMKDYETMFLMLDDLKEGNQHGICGGEGNRDEDPGGRAGDLCHVSERD